MADKTRRNPAGGGFTLIELMVVIAIVTMLIGVLVPGIRALNKMAKDLKQKSQFHSIEISLELFSKDFDGYPDSYALQGDSPSDTDGLYVCGAMHLVEALVGRDLRGFEPDTDWYVPNDDGSSDLYTDVQESLDRRKPPYLEMRDIVAVEMRDVYANCGNVFPSTDTQRAPVFLDIYRKSPILYFKADTRSRLFEKEVDPADEVSGFIYDYGDNEPIVNLNTMSDQTVLNELDKVKFYDLITNPEVDTFDKPYNAKTFILMTAGWDGIFGTKDDLTNYDY